MIKKRIEQLLDALNKGIYEKENELALSLLAAVAGESIILLGPPGVAKSMVARRLSKAFAGARLLSISCRGSLRPTRSSVP